MNKIRKGDEVVVIVGQGQGPAGHRASLLHGEKVLVENINMAKKHQKPNPQRQRAGRHRREGDAAAHLERAIWNAGAKKADRVGIKQLKDGKRVRFFKSNGEVVDA